MNDDVCDSLLNAFREVVAGGWTGVQRAAGLSAHDSLSHDWLQSNWEILVEGPLGSDEPVFLEVYGEGADCNGASSRVWKPDAVATHEIVCLPTSGITCVDQLTGSAIALKDGLRFSELVTIEDGWYVRSPPFDHVLTESTPERVFRREDVRFAVRRL